MTELYLIRHGESEWNRFSRYAGQQDVPLSGLGVKQADQVARRLAGDKFAAIYTSPLQRARQTAEIVGEHLGLPVTVKPGLAEISHGLWEGMTAVQVSEAFPAHYLQWRSQPHQVTMPRGESLRDVATRVQTTLHDILASHAGARVVIASHDAVLRVLLLHCLDLPLEHFWKWGFENASLSIIQADEEAGRPSFRLERLNDVAHLAGLRSETMIQAL